MRRLLRIKVVHSVCGSRKTNDDNLEKKESKWKAAKSNSDIVYGCWTKVG